MKKNEITLPRPLLATKKSMSLTERVLSSRAMQRLAALYGAVLEQPVTPRQALHLTNAQAAFAALLLPFAASILYYTLVLAWCLLALRGCRRAF